jgi:hypothetical protein
MRSARRLARSHLTYSNVVSTLCLFLLLGGVAYAGVKLAADSVGTKQLKDGAVTLRKIAREAQRELRGAATPGVVGPQGPEGDPGERGPQGIPGSGGPLVIDASAAAVAANTTSREVALAGTSSWTPPAGKVGLLLASASMTLATNVETPGEDCTPQIRILDNGRPVATLGSFVTSGPGTATPQQYAAEGVATPVGVLEAGANHTITAHYLGENAVGCAAGSQFDQIRIVVAPLGQ